MRRLDAWHWVLGCGLAMGAAAGCGGDNNGDLFGGSGAGASPGTGGAPGDTGGVATGAVPGTGGDAVTGGVATGGISTTGGVATGGVATGGVATGGVATGGVATGGVATGGGTGTCTTHGDCPAGQLCVTSPAGCFAVVCGSSAECAAYGATCDTSSALCVPAAGTGGTGTGGTGTGGTGTGGTGTGGVATGGVATGGVATGGVATGGVATGGVATGGTGGCSTATLAPCAAIPHFTGTQTVDGDESDVCSLPSFRLDFTAANSGYLREDHTGSIADRTESAVIRLGWSAAGIHAFITVTDPALVPASDLQNLWNGDGVELLFTSSASGLSGDPGNDGVASHVTVAATAGLAAQIATTGSAATSAALAAARYRTTVISGGYTVELLLPWVGTAPTTGGQIALDMALNSADASPVEAPDGRDAQAILALLTLAGTTTCAGTAEPWCDDRTWCTPTLE